METELMSAHQEVLRKRLGELVTEAYKAAGLSRQVLAPQVGVSQRTLYAIENGLSTPRAHTQRQLEEALAWRKGAISDVLSFGSDADIDMVTLREMQPTKVDTQDNGPAFRNESAGSIAQRLNEVTLDIMIELREKDRRIEELERRLEAAERRIKQM